jgi:radical SAM superfamily enzyme with C-terminal helix-hairpin-helix motif
MLMDIVPTGTVMGEVYLERVIGNVTFGRQIGTYPLLVGIPDRLPIDRFVDAIVTSHGERSVTALEHPIRINRISMRALSEMPGIGKRRAASIVRARPFKNERELFERISDSEGAASFLSGNVVFD